PLVEALGARDDDVIRRDTVQLDGLAPLVLVPDEQPIGLRPDHRLAAQVVPALHADRRAYAERLRGPEEVGLDLPQSHVRSEEDNVGLTLAKVALDLLIRRRRALQDVEHLTERLPAGSVPTDDRAAERGSGARRPLPGPRAVRLVVARVEEL